MSFGHPRMLILMAAVLPLLVVFLYWAWHRKRALISRFVQSRLLAQLTVGVSPRRQWVRLGLLVSAVACLFVALARPQWGFDWVEARQRGLDIVVAVDTSRSMLATDVVPNRLARAKLATLDLMRLAKEDRLGLVAFAGTAFLQCPLTLDEDAFRQSLDALEPGIIPEGGTAIAEAIRTAMGAFKDTPENHKILVLFTDGEDHEEGAVPAAVEAAKAGLRIFTVGVGTADGELLRVSDGKGRFEYLKDESGNVVKSRLNESLLKELSSAAQGFHLNLQGARTMNVLYERGLSVLPKSESSARLFRRYQERFGWPLLLAIVLLLVETFFPERRRVERTAEMDEAAQGRLRPLVSSTTPIILLGLWIGCAGLNASTRSALRDFEAGRFRESQREYERLLQEKPDDLRLQFNAGSSAYQAGDYDRAARHLERALAAQDLALQEQAYYNLGNAQFRSGQSLQEPGEKLKRWEESAGQFQSALKIKADDADARHNLDVVQKQIEELRQQMQKDPSKSPDSGSKEDDSKDQQKEQKQDQQGKGSNKPESGKDPSGKDPASNPKQDSQKDKGADSSGKDGKDPGSPSHPEAGKSGQGKDAAQPSGEQKPAGSQGQEDGKDGKEGTGARAAGKDQRDPVKEGDRAGSTGGAVQGGVLSQEQVRQILDSQRAEERAMIFRPQTDPQKARVRGRKDW